MTFIDRVLPWLMVFSVTVLGIVLLTGALAYTNVEFVIAGHVVVLVVLLIAIARRWQVRNQGTV